MLLRRFSESALRKKVTVLTVRNLKKKHIPITMCTAYSYPQASHLEASSMDMILVGDSLGMVELGYKETIPVTVDDIIHHSQAVRRGTQNCLLVADMPFGSYGDISTAYTNAVRIFKESSVDAVKLEGGEEVAPIVSHLVQRGIAVMGHVGLTPQSTSVLGGFRVQGKSATAAYRLLKDAMALERSGCFSIVAECIPSVVATEMSSLLSIPVIGIGSGHGCDGQVLVYHDLLGVIPGYRKPSFSKAYANVAEVVKGALDAYGMEVRERSFPSDAQSFKMSPEEEALFRSELEGWKQHIQKEKESSGKESDASAAASNIISVY